MQDHRKLRVWKHAHELAIQLRRAVRNFPRRGYGSLQTQIVRAAESIVLNIAEGCGSTTQKELARFLDIGIKSSVELKAQLELARDYGALAPAVWVTLSPRIIDARRMLCGLRAKVLRSRDRKSASNTNPNSNAKPTPDTKRQTGNSERGST